LIIYTTVARVEAIDRRAWRLGVARCREEKRTW
jgi:hypothetical protein